VSLAEGAKREIKLTLKKKAADSATPDAAAPDSAATDSAGTAPK
jgi:hypothetical protein